MSSQRRYCWDTQRILTRQSRTGGEGTQNLNTRAGGDNWTQPKHIREDRQAPRTEENLTKHGE